MSTIIFETAAMMHFDRALGLVALVLCALVMFIWIPLDIDSGIIEKVRRSVQLGDAFAPAVATGVMTIGAVLLILSPPTSLDPGSTAGARASAEFVAALLGVLLAALLLMRYTGPLAVELLGDGETPYRLLRDTPPWKFIGFLFGGAFLVTGLIALVERRLRWRQLLVGLVAAVLLIVLYDLPFDDLLLPPNGDV